VAVDRTGVGGAMRGRGSDGRRRRGRADGRPCGQDGRRAQAVGGSGRSGWAQTGTRKDEGQVLASGMIRE
jgi:hypothetical protein